MRVAMLGPYSGDPERVSGGPEAVVVQLVRGLQRAGVEVHVVTFDFTGTLDADTTGGQDGVTVHRLRLRRLPRWTGVRVNARALAKKLQAIAPDVVHAHSSGTFADGALGSGLPAVITVHGVIEQEAAAERRSGITWREDVAWRYETWYERHNLRRARDVIAISPYVADVYRGMTGARLHLVENPVADAYFSLPDRAEPGTILCAARVIQRKNVLGLLQAFALVRRELPAARLRLAGETTSEPGYAGQCRQFVEQNGLSGVVDFLGWLDETALRAEYSRCPRAGIAVVAGDRAGRHRAGYGGRQAGGCQRRRRRALSGGRGRYRIRRCPGRRRPASRCAARRAGRGDAEPGNGPGRPRRRAGTFPS